MSDKTQVMTATLFGAALGAAVGFVFFTESGRTLRRRIEPVVEGVTRELTGLGGTVARTAAAASDGWRLLADALDDRHSGIA
jgi:hypothetical protein